METYVHTKDMYTNVHSNIIHNIQNMEAIQMSAS